MRPAPAAALIGFLAAIAIIAPSSGRAQPEALDVQELLGDCEGAMSGRGSGYDAGFCLGVISGVGSMLSINCEAIRRGLSGPDLPASSPASTVGAATQAFINWARDNPQKWGEDHTTGAILALLEAFPCSE